MLIRAYEDTWSAQIFKYIVNGTHVEINGVYR